MNLCLHEKRSEKARRAGDGKLTGNIFASFPVAFSPAKLSASVSDLIVSLLLLLSEDSLSVSYEPLVKD